MKPRIFLLALTSLLFFVSICVEAAEQKPLPGDSLYNLSSTWTSQEGDAVNIASLAGQPAVVAMIYTHCKSVCPLIVDDMAKIEDELSKQPHKPVRFVLFSFDPERDTPEQLKDFANAHHLDLKRWLLLSGDKDAVQSLAAALDFRYRRNPKGDFDHSAMISILDSEGRLFFQQSGAGNIKPLMSKLDLLALADDQADHKD